MRGEPEVGENARRAQASEQKPGRAERGQPSDVSVIKVQLTYLLTPALIALTSILSDFSPLLLIETCLRWSPFAAKLVLSSRCGAAGALIARIRTVDRGGG